MNATERRAAAWLTVLMESAKHPGLGDNVGLYLMHSALIRAVEEPEVARAALRIMEAWLGEVLDVPAEIIERDTRGEMT